MYLAQNYDMPNLAKKLEEIGKNVDAKKNPPGPPQFVRSIPALPPGGPDPALVSGFLPHLNQKSVSYSPV